MQHGSNGGGVHGRRWWVKRNHLGLLKPCEVVSNQALVDCRVLGDANSQLQGYRRFETDRRGARMSSGFAALSAGSPGGCSITCRTPQKPDGQRMSRSLWPE
jgi:hypothetical protein